MKQLIRLCLLGVALQVPLSEAQINRQKSNLSALSQVVSTTTANALSTSYLSSMVGGMGVYRWNLSEATDTGHGLKGQAAASEDSPWSLWATPLRSTFSYNIEPFTSRGAVNLLIGGLEYRGNGPWMGGLSLSFDQTSATTLDSSATPVSSGSMTGRGFTLAPYAVYQLSPTRALDLSFGGGPSSNELSEGTTSSKWVNKRRLASLGLTDIQDMGRFLLIVKAGYSLIKDPAYVQRSNSEAYQETFKRQTRLGFQLMMPGEIFSPFFAFHRLGTSQSDKGFEGDSSPKYHSPVGQLQFGLNVASGPVFGSLVLQRERDVEQLRAYIGYRY